METYTLNNGKKIPKFGLGTFRVEAGESAYDTVKLALKIGYRHIDTAIMYGNESDIGRAIRDSGIPREEIFVTSKLAKHYDGDIVLIKEALDISLKTLNIGYIDLMLIHWPDHDHHINNLIWKIFESYYQEGLFKSIGVSNFQIHHLENLLKKAKVRPVMNQVECHPLLSQVPLQKYLTDNDILMTSYGPLARGEVFTGKTHEVLEEIAKQYGATVAQVIVQWGLARGIVMIPKSVHEERLIENFKGQELVLAPEDIEKINQLNRGRRLYSDPDNNINFL